MLLLVNAGMNVNAHLLQYIYTSLWLCSQGGTVPEHPPGTRYNPLKVTPRQVNPCWDQIISPLQVHHPLTPRTPPLPVDCCVGCMHPTGMHSFHIFGLKTVTAVRPLSLSTPPSVCSLPRVLCVLFTGGCVTGLYTSLGVCNCMPVYVCVHGVTN